MNTVRILAVGIGGFAQGYLDGLLKEENPDFEIVTVRGLGYKVVTKS